MIEINKIYTYTNKSGYTTRNLVTRITDKSVFVQSISDGVLFPEHREGRKHFERTFYIDSNQNL